MGRRGAVDKPTMNRHSTETTPHPRIRRFGFMDRRQFLRVAGSALALPAASAVLGACGSDKKVAAPTTTAPATGASTTAAVKRKVKIGFIALTDAASVIMAKELGYFDDMGLDVSVEKQASWPALRDALLNGQIDAAHGLFSLPLSVAAGVGGNKSTDLRIAMALSQNGQAITLANEFKGIAYGDAKAAGDAIKKKGASTSLAMTFPGGTHDLWLRYWLHAAGVDAKTIKVAPVPPPQMVANMTAGNVQGYCVGEPWNAVAVKQNIGFTHLATQDLWEFHTEKALLTNKTFADGNKDALVDVMVAVLRASKWLDEPANRVKAADTIGATQYVNAPAPEIAGRLAGIYELGGGLGTKTFTGNQMQFFRDGKVNLPRSGHLLWFAAQYQRLGLVTDPIANPKNLVDSLILKDLYPLAAAKAKVAIPDDDMTPFQVQLDKTTFDPAKLDEEIKRT